MAPTWGRPRVCLAATDAEWARVSTPMPSAPLPCLQSHLSSWHGRDSTPETPAGLEARHPLVHGKPERAARKHRCSSGPSLLQPGGGEMGQPGSD